MSNYVQLRDGLAIYKQKGSKNYYVYMRQKDDSGQSFEFRKSTRTPDLSKATEEAYGYYFSYTKKLTPEIFEANSKSKVINICNSLLKILDEKTKSSDKRSPQSAAYATCIRNEIIPNLPPSLVIKSFDKKLIKSILNLAKSTTKRRNLTSSIKKIFEYAEDEGLIKSYQVPEISTDEKVEKSEPRRSFSDLDFLNISDSFSNFTKQKGLKPCSKIYRSLLMYKFYFLYHTGCRPGEEVDKLKYSCVTRASKGSYKLRFNGTKTDRDAKSRIIELTEDALMCIIDVHKHFNASLYSHLYSEKKGARGLTANLISHNSEFIDVFFNNKDDDKYIFRLPSKQSKKLDWTNYFKQFMDSLSLDYTLYSCRHTFITQRLLEGKSVENVALYCGTSVAMIEKYYSDVEAEMISSNVNANRITVRRPKTKPTLSLD
ncbi:site-specific integrase [Vibrio parahaemolyticus]|nr:site-specific integrase [Vibrio parahaemolyticus]HAV1415403.1 site-specific integrase [Vibrio parahaemolyticus]HAV2008204.1 site-specific integrase [Vibrio parahaemolyticus]HCG6770100.1 site-specific integrase [Vibrio parahaemolyticus]